MHEPPERNVMTLKEAVVYVIIHWVTRLYASKVFTIVGSLYLYNVPN